MSERYRKGIMNFNSRKVVVVGAGAVGSATAFALAQAGLAEEICVVDVNERLAKGQTLDLSHGTPFYPAVRIRTAPTPEAYRDAAIVIVTAGRGQAGPGETRLDLLKSNVNIVTAIVRDIQQVNPNAILIIASNPMDVLTQLAQRATQWPRRRILGSGTVLDSARFRWLLAEACGVSPHNMHASILGEHGDSEFAAWSMTHMAGLSMKDQCTICQKCKSPTFQQDIIEEVRQSAYHIIGYKGSTSFGVAMALTQIVRAILRNERLVLTVSACLEGEYGLNGVSLGVPCVVGSGGIEEIIEAPLLPNELEALRHSAQVLLNAMQDLDKNGDIESVSTQHP